MEHRWPVARRRREVLKTKFPIGSLKYLRYDDHGRITAKDYQPKQVATTEATTLTTDQREALKLFSEKNGQDWKHKLNLAWASVSYEGVGSSQSALLQQVCKQFEPEWLVNLKTDDLYPEVAQQPTVAKAKPKTKAQAL